MATKEELLLALLDVRKHEECYLIRVGGEVSVLGSADRPVTEILGLALMQVDLKSKSQFVLFLDTPRTAIFRRIEEETARQSEIEGRSICEEFSDAREAVGLILESFRPAGRQVQGSLTDLTNTLLQCAVVLVAVIEWLRRETAATRLRETIRLVVDKTFYSGDGK